MTLARPDSIKRSGIFVLSSGNEIFGELMIAGENTNLYLRSTDPFGAIERHSPVITGQLYDLTKITLINCNIPPSGYSARQGGHFHFCNAFPHFVLEGDYHLAPERKGIDYISFSVDDARSIFNDRWAFGTIINQNNSVFATLKENFGMDPINLGQDPWIQFFSGNTEIIAVDTCLGFLSAVHFLSSRSPSPLGVAMESTINICLKLSKPIDFQDSIERVLVLLRFFEIVSGREQNIADLTVGVNSAGDRPQLFRVHWSLAPGRRDKLSKDDSARQYLLLDSVARPDEFKRVAEQWIRLDPDRIDARVRFHGCFSKHLTYDVDRLVGAANMFDILPSSATPDLIVISKETEQAASNCRQIFRELPKSDARESVLNCLGRLGHATLRDKIEYRASMFPKDVLNLFPDLNLVIKHSVLCRNHYVHGSKTNLRYSTDFLETVGFFTDALEFIFAASDFVEAGWDMSAWSRRHSAMHHPFDRLRFEYSARLHILTAILERAANAPKTT